MSLSSVKGRWALVLGSSSGFGEAIALRLSELGMNIAGVHMDRKGTLPKVEEIVQKIRGNGVKAMFFNANAADAEKRASILTELATQADNGLHCPGALLGLRFLEPFIPKGTPSGAHLSRADEHDQ